MHQQLWKPTTAAMSPRYRCVCVEFNWNYNTRRFYFFKLVFKNGRRYKIKIETNIFYNFVISIFFLNMDLQWFEIFFIKQSMRYGCLSCFFHLYNWHNRIINSPPPPPILLKTNIRIQWENNLKNIYIYIFCICNF